MNYLELTLLIMSAMFLASCGLQPPPLGPAPPAYGTYEKTVVIRVAESCGEVLGYYVPNKEKAFICITKRKWDKVFQHEAMHLIRDMTGLPQPSGHEIVVPGLGYHSRPTNVEKTLKFTGKVLKGLVMNASFSVEPVGGIKLRMDAKQIVNIFRSVEKE